MTACEMVEVFDAYYYMAGKVFFASVTMGLVATAGTLMYHVVKNLMDA